MLSFMNQLRYITRTDSSSQNPMVLEKGRTLLEFFRSGSSHPYFMRATVPQRLDSEMPEKGDTIYPAQKSSTIIPPQHWHSNQDETFRVVSGRMVALINGRQRVLAADEEVVIKRGEYHTFSNGSAEERLVIDVKLNPDNRARDELFFRNGYGYLDDCTRAGRSPSPFQFLLFLWSADVIPALPGPKVLMAPLTKFIAWFGGVVVGKYILGYKERYPEYSPRELLETIEAKS